MAFASLNGDNKEMSEINVTPLVDVMLVLLIVFMITMPVLTQSIPLELPVADVKKQDEPKKIMRIAINKDGIYIERDLLSDEALKQALKEQFERDKDAVVAISADKSVAYEQVIKVLEFAQKSGLAKIGFVTEQEK